MSNAPNSSAENKETKEFSNRERKNQKIDFLEAFRKDVEHKLEKDRLPYYDELLSAKTLDDAKLTKNELVNFLKAKENAGKFPAINENDFSLDDLKSKFGFGISDLRSSRERIKKTLMNEFDVDYKEYEADIFPFVKGLTKIEIADLMKSKAKRNEFVALNLKNKTPEPKIKFTSSTTKKFESEIQNILNSKTISKDKKEKFAKLLANIDAADKSKPWDNDIQVCFQELIESKLLSDAFTKELIELYLPFMSLKDAYENKIINEKEAIALARLHFKDDTSKDKLIKKKLIEEKYIDSIMIDTEVLLREPKKQSSIIKSFKKEISENLVEDWNTDFNDVLEAYKNEGPQTIKELKKLLKTHPKATNLSNVDRLGVDAIIEVEKKNAKGAIETSYLRIVDAKDDEKKIYLATIGGGDSINLGSIGNSKGMNYIDFEKVMLAGKIKAIFYNDDDIKGRITNPNDELMASNLLQYNKSDLKNEHRKKELEEKFLSRKEQELKDLLEQKAKNESEGKKDEMLDGQIEEAKRIAKNKNYTETELLEYVNLTSLIDKVNELDPENNTLGLSKGVYLEASDGTGHLIEGIDLEGQTLTINTQGRKYNIDFDTFYKIFKDKKIKRAKSFRDMSDMIEAFKLKGGDVGGAWSKFKLDGGKLTTINENKEYKTNEVEYFISERTNDIIKIKSIDGNKVTVQYGERKSRGSLDKKDKLWVNPEDDKKKAEAKQEVLFLSSTTQEMSLNDLKIILEENKNDFKPSLETGKTKEDIAEIANKNRHFDPLQMYLNWWSAESIYTAGKMFYDGIDAYLNKGRDLRAAKLLKKVAKIIEKTPFDEVASELTIKVEREESEAQDKALDDLKKIDSWMAVIRIKDWLLNKNTPEYKKEAGLIFMLEGYGHLTAKNALKDYAGKFLWYEAFGGTVGDAFYMEQKQKSEASGIPFSEENLMYEFVKKQCGGTGFNGIKRRSRLYKEYENRWAHGINADYEKGMGDAKNKRTAKDMLTGGMDEMKGGTVSNSFGWLEYCVGRGDSLEVMSEGFFCLLMSGTLLDIDQKSFLKLKTMRQGAGMPIIMAAFSTTAPDMVLFNQTCVEIAKELSIAYPETMGGAYAEAQELFKYSNSSERRKVERSDRITKAEKFWKKYGKAMSRSIFMAHKSDGEFAKTDKIVMLKKDENPVFKMYLEKVKAFSDLGNTFNKDFMNDSAGFEGAGGLDTYKVARQYLTQRQSGGFQDPDAGPNIWKIMTEDIKSVPDKTFHDDPEIDRKYKLQYLTETLRDITGAIIELHGLNIAVLMAFNNSTSDIGQDFKSRGLNIMDLVDYSSKLIRAGDADAILSKVAENIVDKKSGVLGIDPLKVLQSDVQDSVANATRIPSNYGGLGVGLGGEDMDE